MHIFDKRIKAVMHIFVIHILAVKHIFVIHFLMSYWCLFSVTLLNSTMGRNVVCGCGIFWTYSLVVFTSPSVDWQA